MCMTALLLLLFMAGCHPAETESRVSEPVGKAVRKKKEYTVVPAQTRTLEKKLTVDGRVVYGKNAKLIFKHPGGTLKALRVKTGDAVAKGDTLAELEREELETTLAVKEKEWEMAALRYEELKTRQEIDGGLQYEIKEQEMDRELLWLEMEGLRKRVREAVLTAPVPGIVTFVEDCEEGYEVPANKTFVRISEPDDKLVISDLFSAPGGAPGLKNSDFSGIYTGMKVQLEYKINRNNQAETITTSGTVTNITQTASQEAAATFSSFPPFFLTVVPEQPFPSDVGDDTKVKIVLCTGKREGVVTVPKEALIFVLDKKLVYVVRNGKRVQREVVPGYIDMENGYVEIVSGVCEGEAVILNADD